MENLDDSENNAKISDSAYSISCSNSQSRRSHSSKSTHSGSNSSGSSGYGGKPSTSSSSNNLSQPSKKEKDLKKKKHIQETVTPEVSEKIDVRPAEPAPVCVAIKEEIKDVVLTPAPTLAKSDDAAESMDTSVPVSTVKEEVASIVSPPSNVTTNYVTSRPTSSYSTTGFSCVISMHDGIVMYTTSSLTTTLGFPKEMWIGRSFIDFVHPRDRNTFASQITSGLAVPKIVNGTQEKGNPASNMVCRIRRYRGLTTSFGVKDRVVTFMPFFLKFTFKNVSHEEGKVIYLVIQAKPFFSAFRIPHEVVSKAVPFVMRHAANGNLEYIDPESVPYLGYLPQDVTDKDALQLYHPEDLDYLQQVYETIVKEGGVPRTKAYRMMAQNGDYLKLETEWSSFINPWSKRLEFVIGKHHIIEGPLNPDVFQSPDSEKAATATKEEKAKALKFKENIVRIMNEVLTKPAEVAKQQMTKRCQDLASFMESLMEEQQTKIDEELRLDIQDPDHSYYERDSVMLGGISPHHEYNDSKCSTDTPLSYNQLNYNETLQRYFESHMTYSCEECNVGSEKLPQPMELGQVASSCLFPLAQNSGDSVEQTSSCGSSAVNVGSPLVTLGDYQPPRLTESLLTKHNAEMEKELMKIHREHRTGTKSDKEKTTNETRQKKKEHLARCNATLHRTITESGPSTEHIYKKPHGVKRASKQIESEACANKHHCPSPKTTRRKHSTSTLPANTATVSTTAGEPMPSAQWAGNAVNNMNTYILGVGIPQQMSVVSPMTAMPGMFQMYYTPAASAAIPAATEANTQQEAPMPAPPQFQPPAMPCMMYGQPMYGPPIVYSPMSSQVTYPVQQSGLGHSMQYTSAMNPLCLTNSNYEEACKVSFPPRSNGVRRTKKRLEAKLSKNDQGSVENSSCSTNALQRSTEAVPESAPPSEPKTIPARAGNSEGTVERTDGESSYSSFYSSFFKTESGSAEESSDAKKSALGNAGKTNEPTKYDPQVPVARRKMEPPWMEQVCVTSELIYKYQITTKPMDDTLKSDQQKMSELTQPSLVNEQLGQLYLDLQLEGVAARLTLEEGITSSSSSSEEASTSTNVKQIRRKREYSKIVMIYEENAPIPPPTADDVGSASSRSMS